jgi:hypothetical protein
VTPLTIPNPLRLFNFAFIVLPVIVLVKRTSLQHSSLTKPATSGFRDGRSPVCLVVVGKLCRDRVCSRRSRKSSEESAFRQRRDAWLGSTKRPRSAPNDKRLNELTKHQTLLESPFLASQVCQHSYKKHITINSTKLDNQIKTPHNENRKKNYNDACDGIIRAKLITTCFGFFESLSQQSDCTWELSDCSSAPFKKEMNEYVSWKKEQNILNVELHKGGKVWFYFSTRNNRGAVTTKIVHLALATSF